METKIHDSKPEQHLH